MSQLAIIADDLSSATDCGIQVAKSGLQTLVPLEGTPVASAAQEADVVSLDTDSRMIPPAEAYRRVKAAASAVVSAGFRHIYKSMDSTLRGNLGAEVDAVLDVFRAELAVVAPAYPLYGRTTVGGVHFLNGKPITESEFATDPGTPVTEADLVRLFSAQSKRQVDLVPLDTLRQGNAAVAQRLAALRARGVELVVFDAQVESDLDKVASTVATTVAANGVPVLWVGSTGLARCVPGALGMEARDDRETRHASALATDLTMLVSGSASEVTHAQIAHLEAMRDVVTVEMNPFQLVAGDEAAADEMARCEALLLEALKGGTDVLLHVTSSRADVAAAQALGLKRGLDSAAVSTGIVTALAHVTRRVADSVALRGVTLTGGDTAKAVCGQLGGVGIKIWEEVEPGIPLGRLVGEQELLVVTKAGGFGTPEALVNALDAIKRDRGE